MNFLSILFALFGSAGVAGLSGGSGRSENDADRDATFFRTDEGDFEYNFNDREFVRDDSEQSGPPPQSDPDPEPEPEPEAEFDPEPEPEPEPEAQTDPDPQPAPAPQPAPTPAPEPNSAGPIDLSGNGPIDVAAGRVSTLDFGGNVSDVRILNGPDAGNLTVNPDNTLALVLTGTSHQGPLEFTAEVTYADNSTQIITKSLNATPLLQKLGWATGEKHYMLETDDEGELVIEHGDNHRLVHVSNSNDALSLADIAALEGLKVDDITGEWLAKNPDYGSDPNVALDEKAGMTLWRELTGENAEPSSHWLLFERGHEYSVGRLIEEGTKGESELHPIHVGAYGKGDAPKMLDDIRIFQSPSSNIVFSGIEADGDIGIIGGGKNIIFDSMTASGEIGVNKFSGLTIRDSAVHDVRYDAPVDGADTWAPGTNRISGTFVTRVKGLLMEGNVYDHNGWASDYDYDLSGDDGQPPSLYSHNIYLQHDNQDVTLRDNIVMRGASFGAQVRSGGFIEDNVFIDNNAAVNYLGGRPDRSTEFDGDRTGHFTLFADNLVTSGAYKQAGRAEGALTRGIDSFSREESLVDNIVTHLANPDDADEQANSIQNGGGALRDAEDAYYDDTIVYNWVAGNELSGEVRFRSPDANTDGLDPAVLDQTTIQRFTADLLGVQTATIDDLAQYLRAEMASGALNPVDADQIIDYFQQSFGIAPNVRTQATELQFVPNDLADGVRWDNRLNWDTEDLPGQIDGDSVDLAGNWVVYAARTSTISGLDFGSGGKLAVTSGYLGVEGPVSVGDNGAEVDISGAGQFWVDGYSDTDILDLDIAAGRFANTGDFTGTADLDVQGGQALLATSGGDMHLGDGSRLAITGSDAKVGFDGADNGIATLHVDAGGRIDFIADADGIAGIGEFRSGKFDEDDPKVTSGIDLGGGTLGIDLDAWGGKSLDTVLFRADEIVGNFDAIEIIGLGAKQDATITFDYITDEVSLKVTAANGGSGLATTQTVGNMLNAQNAGALWNALTNGQGTYDDTLPPPNIQEVEDFAA